MDYTSFRFYSLLNSPSIGWLILCMQKLKILFSFTVGEADGLMALFVVCFVCIVWWIKRWQNVTASPVTSLENWALGHSHTNTFNLLTDLLFQMSGAVLSRGIIIKYFWSWKLRPIHKIKFTEFSCVSSLKVRHTSSCVKWKVHNRYM